MSIQLKPSDLRGEHPWNSVDQKSESETCMCKMVSVLADNGDTWRELPYEEYKAAGGRNPVATVNRLNDYLKSADTIILYSPHYKSIANKLKTETNDTN